MINVPIKSAQEADWMRESGCLLAQVFDYLDTKIKPGVNTFEINEWVEDYIFEELKARPASIGQYDYQYALNSSINHVVCHGIPDEKDILENDDIVNIDITLEKNGYIADSSKMYIMPGACSRSRHLVNATYEAMWQGIRAVKPGARLGDIGYAIQSFAESHGYSIVREYCGHGIGREMHEEPHVLHYGHSGTGLKLEVGMTFTIEPMVNQGTHRTKIKEDGWTVVTQDKKLSAQWEHTVLVTDTGFEVLTLRSDEKYGITVSL